MAELTSYLAIEQDVTVIGRDKEKMASIVQRNPETCHPLIVDYCDEELLSNALQRAVQKTVHLIESSRGCTEAQGKRCNSF